MTTVDDFEPGSYRDRQGRVFYLDDRVFRALSSSALADWQALSATEFFRQSQTEGRLVATRQLDHDGGRFDTVAGEWAAFLEHDRVPVISYPYEWSFGMLRDAALLHLDLLLEALAEDLILKDSSAYNIQWIGTRPLHIDIPSFERWQPGEPWVGYRQFCQLFLYPLMLTAYRNLPFQPWLRGALDGITPQECARLMSARDFLRPGVMTHVVLQSKLLEATADSSTSLRKDLKASGFDKELIAKNARGLRKVVTNFRWKQKSSEWSSYTEQNSYTDHDEETKRQFVGEAVSTRRWGLAWDLGCNTGRYARLAAEHADSVVAMDADHLTVDRLYTELRAEGDERILPLLMNLADPSPNLGWRGLERRALADRRPVDLVLCLALIHHLVITANIPLYELVCWFGGLGSWLIIEFVTKDDPMVQRLLLSKEDIYNDYSLEAFEREIAQHFQEVARLPLPNGTRTLFFLRPR